MVSKIIFTFFIIIWFTKGIAQNIIKIKKEDNRLLFYQLGTKNDTLIINKSDLFYIKLPDSLSNVLKINVENGLFTKTKTEYIYQLKYINGMKYSHSIKEALFITTLEGASLTSNIINISIINTSNSKISITNKFIVK